MSIHPLRLRAMSHLTRAVWMMLVAVGFAFIKLASSGEHIMLGSVLMVIGATVAVSSEFVLGCMSWLSASPAIRVKVESKDENSS